MNSMSRKFACGLFSYINRQAVSGMQFNLSKLSVKQSTFHHIHKPLLCCNASNRCMSSDDSLPASDNNAGKKFKVLYDGDCPLCVQEIKFVQYMNKKKNTLDLVDISSPDYKPEENNNISYETAMDVMHVIGPNQQVYTKVPAMYEMYSALGMRWIVAYMRWPVLSMLFDKAYMVFARNRLSLTSGWRDCEDGKCRTPKQPSQES